MSRWKSLSQESGVANSQKPWKANLFNLPRDLKSWSTKLPRLCFTLSTLMLESMFLVLFFGHFLWYWQGDWLNRQNFLGWWSFPLFSWSLWLIQQYYCKEKLDAGHSYSLTCEDQDRISPYNINTIYINQISNKVISIWG